ncbi:MAG: hypothetical protein IPJ81_14675 [Chitinophagaceae bacterium]|nr:hypothetical protein [Chitinophagaceae bacterium]
MSHANRPHAAINNISVESGVKTDTMLNIQQVSPPNIIGRNLKTPPVIKVGMPYSIINKVVLLLA